MLNACIRDPTIPSSILGRDKLKFRVWMCLCWCLSMLLGISYIGEILVGSYDHYDNLLIIYEI